MSLPSATHPETCAPDAMNGWKQAEIERVPDGWESATLGEIAKFQTGGTPSRDKPEFWQKGDIPWVKTAQIDYRVISATEEKITREGLENSSTKVFPKGTLLVAMYGQGVTRGRAGILGIDAATNQACAAINPYHEDEVATWFIYYFLQYHYEDLRQMGHGANQRNLNMALLRGFPIAYPKAAEQQKIAHVLGVVQRAMEQQEQLLALTAELKKVLLHQLFTAGRRGEPQKQTDLGPVPESWKVGVIGDVAKIQSGGTPTRDVPENWHGGTIPWVKTGEIDYCTIQTTEERITPVGLDNSAARLFPAGTLLMAMYGQGVTRGRVAMLGIEATTNQACASITPHEESKVSSHFLYYFLEYHYET